MVRYHFTRQGALQRAGRRRISDSSSSGEPLLDEQHDDGRERTPSTAQLAIDDHRCASSVAANHDLNELAEVREVWWTLRCNGYARVSELEVVPDMSALRHDVLEYHDVFAVDLLPDRNDGSIRRLSMQENAKRV